MKKLLKNATIVNVFTDELQRADILIDGDKIVGVGDYADEEAAVVEDLAGKHVCPGFIDGHIHIESTMLIPSQLAKVSLLHGTTCVVADPHEIANVCGRDGISYMLEASKEIPLKVFITLPSCVPASPFDESGANLTADDLTDFYAQDRVVGLAEMMNYPGVIFGDKDVHQKIADAKAHGKVVDGHAPLLSGKNLDKYLSAGIRSDHECSNFEEAQEKLRKGQWIFVREGTAAHNLQALSPLFDAPYSYRCVLATDDRHPADLLKEGHIDNIVRKASAMGKSVVAAIRMATLQAAQYFSLFDMGAVAPGYKADLLVLDDLDTVKIRDVYVDGRCVVRAGKKVMIKRPSVGKRLDGVVRKSFLIQELTADDFAIAPESKTCRVIQVRGGDLLTDEYVAEIDWEKDNGIDVSRDILKLAVIERHGKSGNKGIGFVRGIGLGKGAIASSVSHDSHNLIVVGTNAEDMALAANRIIQLGGGNVVVAEGEVLAEMPLPIAGLMSEKTAREVATENEKVREAVKQLGVADDIEPFMNTAFVSLSVIPHLKMTPGGLVDVDKFERVSLFVKE